VYTTQDNGLSTSVKSARNWATHPPTQTQSLHQAKYTPNYNTTLHLLCNSPLRKTHLCVWLCSYLIISALALWLFSRVVENALSLIKRLSKLQLVGPSGCTKASWRCQSGARRNERSLPLLIWVTQAPSALTRLLGSRTRNPFSLARLNMKYRTGWKSGGERETGCFGSVSEL